MKTFKAGGPGALKVYAIEYRDDDRFAFNYIVRIDNKYSKCFADKEGAEDYVATCILADLQASLEEQTA